MEQGLFFPSKNGDRKYKASDFTGYFSKLFSNGVFSNNSKNLQVIASATNGLSLIVEAGYGNINGYLYQLSEPKTVVFNIADVSGTAKKGSVVLRMDLTERKMTVEAKGTDDLTRNATVYELMLARILIPGNGKPITQGMIQDTRGDGNVCGFVSSLIDIDPTTLWTQFEADWNEWLTEIKGTVGDDAAANLALSINDIKSKMISDKNELRNYVNEELEKKQNTVKNTGWVRMELINGWKGEVWVKQEGTIIRHRGYIQSGAGVGIINATVFNYPPLFDIGNESRIKAFILPEGEMNAPNFTVSCITGYIQASKRDFHAWFKNTVGDCCLDFLSFDASL